MSDDERAGPVLAADLFVPAGGERYVRPSDSKEVVAGTDHAYGCWWSPGGQVLALPVKCPGHPRPVSSEAP